MVEEQKEFVSNASHELRTPLTVLKTEIEVALRDKSITPKAAKELIKSNLEEVNKIQALSNYLLRLSRYESEGKISMAKVNLKRIALKAIGKMKVKADLKKSTVMGNEDALAELITIFLDNAARYNPKGTEIGVRVKSGVIEVWDKGTGIAKEDLPHIFDRFFRGEASRSKAKADGYGLGLAIAKSIVELHKGKIGVESEVGKGTTFRVEI
jgi:signal transduction histidine kinase